MISHALCVCIYIYIYIYFFFFLVSVPIASIYFELNLFGREDFKAVNFMLRIYTFHKFKQKI